MFYFDEEQCAECWMLYPTKEMIFTEEEGWLCEDCYDKFILLNHLFIF